MEENELGDKGTRRLCKALQDTNKLTTLNLNFCGITATGARMLMDCLKTKPALAVYSSSVANGITTHSGLSLNGNEIPAVLVEEIKNGLSDPAVLGSMSDNDEEAEDEGAELSETDDDGANGEEAGAQFLDGKDGVYDDANIFAKILRGEIPSYKIFETDSCIAILDAFPSVAGHSLLIPKAGKFPTNTCNSELCVYAICNLLHDFPTGPCFLIFCML